MNEKINDFKYPSFKDNVKINEITWYYVLKIVNRPSIIKLLTFQVYWQRKSF